MPRSILARAAVSLGHLGTHIGAVVSLGAGAVSFTHIIKALEPMFSVVFGLLINGTSDPLSVNVWLIPIIAGVGWAAAGGGVASRRWSRMEPLDARRGIERVPRRASI